MRSLNNADLTCHVEGLLASVELLPFLWLPSDNGIAYKVMYGSVECGVGGDVWECGVGGDVWECGVGGDVWGRR